MTNNLNQHFWDTRYKRQQTGWDLGAVSPPLKAYFDHLEDKSLKILIPGGGNSYEAEYLVERGFTDVTVVDISGVVIEHLRQQYQRYLGTSLHLIHQDFFEHEGQYNLIVEQTFFCALDPTLRLAYTQHMRELLYEKGKLVGVLFDREFAGGPPFGGNRAEYRQILGTQLEVITLETCYNSIAPRAGSEVFFIAQKKQA
jgi:methyl halide transferase